MKDMTSKKQELALPLVVMLQFPSAELSASQVPAVSDGSLSAPQGVEPL